MRNELVNSRREGAHLFAFEGIGGSGKSHTIKVLCEELEGEGLSVLVHKVSGLGNSKRVLRLKEIMTYRHNLSRESRLTEKQSEDKARDRIFRLATRHQTGELKEILDGSTYEVVLLDRLPFTSWVFAASNNPNNPYLPEIFEECLGVTHQLGIERIFLFDLPPETAYARIIARYAVHKSDSQAQIESACATIGASSASKDSITLEVERLLKNPGLIQPKEFEAWDFIPLDAANEERKKHKEVLTLVKDKLRIPFEVVDVSIPLCSVVKRVKSSILKTVN